MAKGNMAEFKYLDQSGRSDAIFHDSLNRPFTYSLEKIAAAAQISINAGFQKERKR